MQCRNDAGSYSLASKYEDMLMRATVENERLRGEIEAYGWGRTLSTERQKIAENTKLADFG